MAVPQHAVSHPARNQASGGIHDHPHTHDMVCPDPSLHERAQKEKKLQDQAAGAALYVTHPERATAVREIAILDADGRLSSAGAAMSLKYARPQDLPSFPSVGIDRNASASAAATLAHGNQKTVEWWKPEMSANAGKAALLAKDYKMEPLWEPEASSAGSKAALLAHRGPTREWWQAQPSKEGNSAAGIAMRNKNLSPKVTRLSDDAHQKALLAATRSVKGRKRSGSLPTTAEPYPDASKSEFNAYNAAAVAEANHYAAAMEASRITHLGDNIAPEMFTEHPPIALDAEDKKHDDSLRASAIAMAKKMYDMQQVDDEGNVTVKPEYVAATAAQGRTSTGPDSDLRTQALQYLSLQEAAQRLASERLAKIQHPDESAAFRSYYGYPSKKARSRLSIRKNNRDRASSEGATRVGSRLDYDSDDEEQARKIRGRQTQFNEQLAAVDKKRESDRKSLLAAAEKKVHAQMSALDKKVFDDTGKMSPQLVEEWDAKARARAAANSEARMQNHGKVAIGGGKYLDQSEIDAIAKARIQPTLDQINDKAEKQRARDEELRLDSEEKKRQAQEQKQREADSKAERKRIKDQEKEEQKTKKQEEKRAARDEKDALKAKKGEEKRLAAEEKRKSKEAPKLGDAAVPVIVAAGTAGTAGTAATEPAEHLAATSATAGPLDADADAALHAAAEPEPGETGQATTNPAEAELEKHQKVTTDDQVPDPATTTATASTLDASPTEKKKDASVDDSQQSPPQSPTKRSGIRSMFTKFKPKLNKAGPGSFSPLVPSAQSKDKGKAKTEAGSFVGGAALTNSYPAFKSSSSPPAQRAKHNPISTPEPATSATTAAVPQTNAPDRSSSVSSIESDATHESDRGRSRSRDAIATTTATTTAPQDDELVSDVSSVEDEAENKDGEEVRDELTVPPQPAFARATDPAERQSPNRQSKFREEV